MALVAPKAYISAKQEERDAAGTGCGPSSAKIDLVPDTLYGLNVAQACKIHDWEYQYGKSIEDKEKADSRFLDNMLRLIDKYTSNQLLKTLRRRRAHTYYEAVKRFGGPAFWENKTPAENKVA
jgi:hypothetical protein